LENEYSIETAQSGEDALEITQELLEDGVEIPVMISDQIMPEMKGDELLIKIFAISPRTLQILLTGQANADAIGNTVNQANLYRYIPKPWDQEDMTLTIKEAVRSYFQDKVLEEQNKALLQLNKELEESQNRLLQLNQISKYVSDTLDLQQVSHKFIEKAVQVIREEGSGSILLYNEHHKTFVFYASYGLDPKYVKTFEIEVSPDNLYTFDVVNSQKGKILESEELVPFQNEKIAKLHYGRKYVQQLVVPMVSQGKTIGLVSVFQYDLENPFGEQDFQMLVSITKSLSSHFENAQLYTHVKELNIAYERFVPHEFLHILNKESILEVKLGDQIQKNMTVLFSDIRSFTALSETMTPEENFRFINSYLSKMGPIVREHRGFIDKFIGDSIMALFDQKADDALEAAVAMLLLLNEYNEGRRRAGYLPIKIGIGINTGKLMLGTLGDKGRMEGTVISDAVNLASRLEGLTKLYGTPLLISEYTFHNLSDSTKYITRFIDRVKVKGKAKPVTIYEVMDADSPELQKKKLATIKTFEKGCQAFQARDFSQAEILFKECLSQNPEDKACQVYIDRCRHFQNSQYNEDWAISEFNTSGYL